jgi:hypothetical protein
MIDKHGHVKLADLGGVTDFSSDYVYASECSSEMSQKHTVGSGNSERNGGNSERNGGNSERNSLGISQCQGQGQGQGQERSVKHSMRLSSVSSRWNDNDTYHDPSTQGQGQGQGQGEGEGSGHYASAYGIATVPAMRPEHLESPVKRRTILGTPGYDT